MESMVRMTDSFKDKRIIITGHTGFKGSWLALWLNNLGAKVTGIALDPKTYDDAYHAMKINSICNDLRQDINDYEGVLKVFRENKPEVVFHLAAQPLVLPSYNDPLNTFGTNILGTANILEACRNTESVSVIIVVTSDKCYENRESVEGYSEHDRLGGKDPYSASKACAELVAHSYRQSFFTPGRRCSLATVRAGNVIGGGDWSDYRIVPDTIRSLSSGQTVQVRNPRAVRPWQFVLEPLGGYLLLASMMYNEPERYSEAWNFGPSGNNIKTVSELVNEIIRRWGDGSMHSKKQDSTPAETGILRLDISKAREKLMWEPVLSFEESVEMTVIWYRAIVTGKDMKEISLRQIENYELKNKRLSCG